MKKALILILSIALLLCGCDAGYSLISAGASEYIDALSLVQMHVPHIGRMSLRLDFINLLETDSYNRNLFYYHLSEHAAAVLLIVQKTEEPMVYYYEDYCYLVKKDIQGSDMFSEEEINSLKEDNDWDKPLDDAKMHSINYLNNPVGAENVDDYFDTIKKIRAGLEIKYPEKTWVTSSTGPKSTEIIINGLDTYPGYGQVILADVDFLERSVVVDDELWDNSEKMQHKWVAQEYYLVLYDTNCADPVVAIEPVESISALRESIISFKYSYCGLQ